MCHTIHVKLRSNFLRGIGFREGEDYLIQTNIPITHSSMNYVFSKRSSWSLFYTTMPCTIPSSRNKLSEMYDESQRRNTWIIIYCIFFYFIVKLINSSVIHTIFVLYIGSG